MTTLKNYITSTLLLLLGLLCSISVESQTRAERLLDQYRYNEAARAYERYLKRNEDDGAAFERMGNIYRNLRKFKEAELNYAQAELNGGLSDAGLVNYGQMLLKNGKSVEAKEQFRKYLAQDPESFVVRMMYESLSEVSSWENAPKYYSVIQLEGINSMYADFAPVPYENGIVFATERNVDYVNENTSAWTGLPYLAIYYTEFEDKFSVRTKKPKRFLTRLSGNQNIGPVCIDTVNNQVYFSKGQENPKPTQSGRLGIFVANIEKGKRLSKPKPLSINSDEYSITHPSLTPDGNTLFFASDMDGSMGGMDIYFVTRDGNGGWSSPQRISEGVNTELNEVFPYAVSNSKIYFASDGHLGYGGLDIFESEKIDGLWSEPQNLKEPINSTWDDFGLIYETETRGYFSSERDGGAGRDDIYQFVKLAEPDDWERMDVSGVFDYSPLPPEGVQLRLLDENDNLIALIQTDSLGNFDADELPVDKDYRIEIVDATEEMNEEAEIYLVNEEGETILILDRMSESGFAFHTLAPEKIDGLAAIDMEDKGMSTYSIFGQLYDELPYQILSGMTMILEDDEGNVIQTVVTDSLGLYQFDDVPVSEHYKVKFTGPDSVIHLTSVYYQNDGGVYQVKEEENPLFDLMRLKNARLASKPNQIPAKGVVEYNGKPIPGARLMLVDSNNIHLMAALTDSAGNFNFGRIATGQAFNIILPDSIYNLPGEVDVFFKDSKGNRIALAQESDRPMYSFTSLKADEFYPSQMAEVDSEFTRFGLHGQVFRKLPGDYHDGLALIAFTDDGRIVETVFADSNGVFDFTKLRADQHYNFRVAETDKSNLNVDIYDLNGVLVAHLRLDELSDYFYEKLQSDDAERFRILEVDESELAYDQVAGMLYKELPGDYKAGMKIYAVDEQGNIIDSTYTDGKGNFRFENLDRETDFTLSVADAEDSELSIGFYGYDNKLSHIAVTDSNNQFVYSKLVLEAASLLGEEEEDLSELVFGQVFDKLPGDIPAGTKVYAYDDDGNIIDEAEVDEKGMFQFTKLDPDASYGIRLLEEDISPTFALLDAQGNVISEEEADASGVWSFDKLEHDSYAMALIQANDAALDSEKYKPKAIPKETEVKEKSNAEIIYFDYRSNTLDDEDLKIVEKVFNALDTDPSKFLYIESHIDPYEIKGDWSYSATRSISIVEYLLNKGIDRERLYVINYEDTKMAIDCGVDAECTDHQRGQNQRSELTVVGADKFPTTPDGMLTYEFNQWKLPKGFDNLVFGTIKSLKNNPDWTVQLDGYSDTWGSFTSNNRISQLRGQNIRNIFIQRGIEAERVELIWHGESIPFGGCLVEYPCPLSERTQNRRVEIRVIKP